MSKWHWILVGLLAFVLSCDQDDDLPPPEERRDIAIAELNELLNGPSDGWKLNYQPNSGTGIYFILLDFDENGTVRVRSDVADNGGKYLDQTITYRIDVDLDVELVLETYCVFHYLYEKNQSTFGGGV